MTTQVNGDTGVSAVQSGAVQQVDLAANVVGNGPAFSATNSASQPATASAITKVTINTEDYDTSNAFDTTLSRFTPQVAGYYLITASLRTGGTNMTGTALKLFKNGSEFQQLAGLNNPASTRNETICASTVLFLNGSTDYLELWGVIIGGTSLLFEYLSASANCRFSGCLVRAA